VRTIAPALLASLTKSPRTMATVWLVTRTDGLVFGFTDHDVPIKYAGVTYATNNAITASAIEMSSNLSTSNLEVTGILDSTTITKSDLLAKRWDNAQVSIGLIDYTAPSNGVLILNSGLTGEVQLKNGQFVVELRSLAQYMQQNLGEVYSPLCRANLGDVRCTVNLAPLTVAGVPVTGLSTDPMFIGASSLTQTGPVVPYTDVNGTKVPTTAPYQLLVTPPTGGAFVSNINVKDQYGYDWTEVPVGSTITDLEYSVTPEGLYTFDSYDVDREIFINYNYSIGYFAYGSVTFTSGANAGLSMEVRSFAPGAIELILPMPRSVAIGDQFTIVAGCDRTMGTCSGRFANLNNFRGEPYIPGNDILLQAQET
jgi:hypothetical protein